MKNEIIEVDGSKWLVKKAVSKDAALSVIAWARCRGSVGAKEIVERDGVNTVLADVSRIESSQ